MAMGSGSYTYDPRYGRKTIQSIPAGAIAYTRIRRGDVGAVAAQIERVSGQAVGRGPAVGGGRVRRHLGGAAAAGGRRCRW